MPPGTVVHVGERKLARTRIAAIEYDEQRCEERELASAEEGAALRRRPGVVWLNVEGLHEVEALATLGAGFGLHPLVLEDIANTRQRPKLEDYSDYLYIVAKMLYRADRTPAPAPSGDAAAGVVVEQVSLVLGRGFVLSFQEGGREGDADVFDPVRGRLRTGQGRARRGGADYLAYSLLDAIVDGYFVVLEELDDRVEATEERLLRSPTAATLAETHRLRGEALQLRRAVWPLREVLSSLVRDGSPLVLEATRLYLRDVYDHTVEVIDTIETLREMITEMLDLYLSSVSNRLNEVMKVLTIISTIFMPLTFVAGVYGMNFEHMPELRSPYGYPAVLLVMAASVGGMLLFFRRRGWL